MKMIAGLFLVGLAAGCASPVQQAANGDTTRGFDQAPCGYQRFVPADFPAAAKDSQGLFALDTQTGQICRTANYLPQTVYLDKNGNLIIEKLPTCLSLAQKSGFKEWKEQQNSRK